ncbi:MAG: lipid hydroperoxide peroxidase [Omnitrophica WOR_2 bacterium RIFOXYC2_FULL_45_15]|nr:MAG: lipid hydroperoxide peroxidase [Omnitrophica WOR_2 bacterium RIFOXYC2_FULL_45_15]
MNRKITFKGSPLTLVGRNIKVGNAAPYFRVVAQDSKEVSLLDFKGKIKLVTSFPSIDTPVCDLQVKEFNKRAVGLSSDIVIIGISKDLPFAQARFCQANDIKNILTFSDYKFSSFGINYGLLIKELNLLARAIIILDKNDIIRYIQIVEELTRAPDYNDALKNLEQALKDPQGEIQTELPAKCKACEAGVPALAKEKIEKLLAQYRGWQLVEDKKIVKEFKFKDFVEAKYFLDLVAVIAEEQGHHPNLTLIYNKLKITLTTHSSGGLTENDFIMAKIIDELQG